MDKKIEKIIVSYFDDQITDDEMNLLIEWVNNGNKDKFNQYVNLSYALDQIRISKQKDAHLSWELIEAEINNTPVKQPQPFYKRSLFKYAAAILILVATGYYFLSKENNSNNSNTIVNVKTKIIPGSDKATLTLEDGSSIALEKGSDYAVKNVKSDGEKIIYTLDVQKPSSKIEYNTLTIPRGGQFLLELADNTKVWLNSETQLKYPKSFTAGETRSVELLYGEAYFEVSPSSVHNGSSFSVLSKMQNVEVLGTQFNIKAYRDEQSAYTTLVEGKIAIATNSQKEIMSPNQQAIVALNSEEMKIITVDVYNEISWKEGVFSFDGKSLKEIMKVLSRWYDVEVLFLDKKLEEIKFIGTLNKNQNLETILNLIKETGFINDFNLSSKKLELN